MCKVMAIVVHMHCTWTLNCNGLPLAEPVPVVACKKEDKDHG